MSADYLTNTWILDVQPLQNNLWCLITVAQADTLHHIHNCNKGKYTLKYNDRAYHHWMCHNLTQHAYLPFVYDWSRKEGTRECVHHWICKTCGIALYQCYSIDICHINESSVNNFQSISSDITFFLDIHIAGLKWQEFSQTKIRESVFYVFPGV